MASGDFLSGLARGIYSEQEKMIAEQRERDSTAQKNTINVLADLYSKVRPESQSVILDQLGKAIGVKGKMKTFWQALSGVPDRSVEDQLGTQLRELSAMSVSPQQARGIESKADVARMFGATSPLAQMFQNKFPQGQAKQGALDAEKGLAGKLIFRDPQQEQRDLITDRYEAQTRAALEREAYSKALAQKNALERDEANRKGRINQTFYNRILSSQSKQIAKAYELWYQDYEAGRTQAEPGLDPAAIPPDEYMARAGQLLGRRFDLQGRDIENRMRNRDRQTGAGGQKPMTLAQQAQIDQEIRNEAQKIISAVSSNKAARNTAVAKRDALRKRLDDYAKANGLTFDPNVGVFMGDSMKAANAALMLEIQSGDRNIPDEYIKAVDEANKAQAALDTEFGKLKDKTYEGRVRIGQTADEEINMVPQRGQKPLPAIKGRAGMTTDRLINRGEQMLRIPPETVEIGQEVPFKDGRTYKVIRKGKDHIIVRFIN